jgi:hypothetical protein
MSRTVTVVYDGEVFRPVEPVDLEPNTRYLILLEPVEAQPEDPAGGPFDRILALAQDLGVPDLAEQHDHYLYGHPKR